MLVGLVLQPVVKLILKNAVLVGLVLQPVVWACFYVLGLFFFKKGGSCFGSGAHKKKEEKFELHFRLDICLALMV